MNRNAKALMVGIAALLLSRTAIAEEINLAIVGARSGAVAQWGDMAFTGAQQAINDINARGGINGSKLKATEFDDGCDTQQAVQVARQIVNAGIKYVIGHLCSSSTQPASDLYEEEGVLMITPGATNPALTQRGYRLVLRTVGLDSLQGPTAVNYILQQLKPQRIAILHDKQRYGAGLATAVRDGLQQGGAKVVFFDSLNAGEKDFTALVARLQRERIDLVYYGGYYPELGQLLRQTRAVGLKTQFMGPEGVANDRLTNIAGAAAEGVLVTMPKRYDLQPANSAIVEALKAQQKDPTGPYIWTSYAAVQALAEALSRSPSREPAALAQDLKARGASTVIGPLRWDKQGDVQGFGFGLFQWHAGGSPGVAN